jgi:hypothetical protein
MDTINLALDYDQWRVLVNSESAGMSVFTHLLYSLHCCELLSLLVAMMALGFLKDTEINQNV